MSVSKNIQNIDDAIEKLHALVEASSALHRGKDIDTVLARLMDQAKVVMKAEASSAFMLDRHTGELVIRVATGQKKEDAEQFRLAPGEGIAGTVARDKTPLVIVDAQNDARFSKRFDKESKFKTRSLICVPILMGQQVLGVIEVINKVGGGFFSKDDIPFLEALAGIAAVALENTRLVSALEARAAQLNHDLVEANFEMAQAKNRLESVLFAMEDGVIATDENGEVMLINRVAQIITFGLGVENPVGRPVDEVLPDGRLSEQIIKLQKGGMMTVTIEMELSMPEPRVYAAALTPIRSLEGEFSGLVVVLRDVTRMKELERMKSAFLNTVSHELRTPMTSIRAFSELMAKKTPATEKVVEWSTIIYQEAERLGRLIDDLLDVSRLEAGKKLSIMKSKFDIKKMLEHSAGLFGNFAGQHPIRLVIADNIGSVTADSDRIHQVLSNLISNSIKYSPEGGEVRIGAMVHKGRLRVEVEDQGMGLSEKDRLYVFEKFYRVDKSTTKAIGGTGLGLSICKYIVEAHGGRIGVDSEPGQGSSFWFEIPTDGSGIKKEPAQELPG